MVCKVKEAEQEGQEEGGKGEKDAWRGGPGM